MTTKRNRTREAEKRIEQAKRKYGLADVNPDNWLLRFADSAWCMWAICAVLMAVIVVMLL